MFALSEKINALCAHERGPSLFQTSTQSAKTLSVKIHKWEGRKSDVQIQRICSIRTSWDLLESPHTGTWTSLIDHVTGHALTNSVLGTAGS